MNTISIIIPLFNKADYVNEALFALVAQLLPGDEIVVVDDVSTDGGPNQVAMLAAALPNGVLRLLQQAHNNGPATARNAGAEVATGKYLLFFDADDLPHAQLLMLLRQCIAKHPSEVVFAYDIAVQAHGESADLAVIQPVATLPTQVLSQGAFVRSSLKGKPACTASSTCVRAAEFHASGGFQAGLRYCEDPELWARLSACFALVQIGLTLAVYRDVQTSLSYGLRGQPGSVQPYVTTLMSLSLRAGDEYQSLAQSFIMRNVVFSLVNDAPRSAVLGYVSEVRTIVSGARWLGLLLVIGFPRMFLSRLLRLRSRFNQPGHGLPAAI